MGFLATADKITIAFRMALIVAAILTAYFSLYILWYLLRGRFLKKNNQGTPDRKSPDSRSLNEIMGYEFIKTRYVHDGTDKKEEEVTEEKTGDWEKETSPYMNRNTGALDLTNSEAGRDDDNHVMPDPSFRVHQDKPTAGDNGKENKASKEVKTETAAKEGKPDGKQTGEETIQVSNEMAIALSENGNPWPENDIQEEEHYMNWLLDGYFDSQKDLVSQADPEGDQKEYSLNTANEIDYDALIMTSSQESDRIIEQMRKERVF